MDGELLSLKWNNHRTTFYHVISGLRNKESYTDVTLACDGKFYPVHKLVLSTCSEYFSDIFDRTPCKNPVVVLKDIQCRDLEFLLDYMYIGEVNVRQNELSSLIKAAECLRVKGLAVPDEEPPKKGGSANSVTNSVQQSRQRPEQSSPPAKRRRAEERRATPVATDHSPGRPPGDGSHSSPDRRESHTTLTSNTAESGMMLEHSEDVQGDNSEQTPIVIKEERQDTHDSLVNVQNNYEVGGEDDGDGPHDSEGNTSDFPEFLQSTIEKEEPVAISDYNPEFPGPSGLQNSGLAPWESENSSAGFPEGLSGAVAAAVAAVSQPQQRQQQQLWAWPATHADGMTSVGGSDGGGGSSAVLQEPGEVGCGIGSTSSRLQCNICGYIAQRRQHLQAHIHTHTGEKPHQCHHCAYKCSDIGNLRKHLRTHSVYKPYTCPHCPYSTRTAASLKRHALRHTPMFAGGFASSSHRDHSWSDSESDPLA